MLEGFRVLDLTWVLGGPYATQLLAQLGADVIKVESPAGDMSRKIPPHFVDGESSFFLSVNRGKRSVALDLKHVDGMAALRDLVRVSDVVIYNFTPNVPRRLGIDHASLLTLNPRVCVGEMIGLHDAGEYASIPAFDLAIQALAAELQTTFRAKPAAEWLAALRRAPVPSAMVNNVDEALREPVVGLRQMLETVVNPATGSSLQFLGNAFKFAGSKPLAYPPRLGEHTRAVLRDVCGYEPDRIAALARTGAVTLLDD